MSEGSDAGSIDGPTPEAVSATGWRPRWVVLSVLVALTAGAGAGVGIAGANRAETCPGLKPATGIDHPTWSLEQQSALRTVDTGFARYERDDGFEEPEEGVSFGYVLENTSDLVLYDARINISIVDGSDSFCPLYELSADSQEQNATDLRDVRLPVLFPGEQVGMGGDVTTWEEYGAADQRPDPVNYDTLSIEVSLSGGQWWPPDNDRYEFVPTETELVRHDTEPVDEPPVYESGDGEDHRVEYTVGLSACRSVPDLGASALFRAADGDIVGGSVPGDIDERHWLLGGGRDNSGEERRILPAGDVDARVYTFAGPLGAVVET